jgi:hypothetical protein
MHVTPHEVEALLPHVSEDWRRRILNIASIIHDGAQPARLRRRAEASLLKLRRALIELHYLEGELEDYIV